MTDTIIFLGNGAGADAIRGNLTDLATLGLIEQFFWADLGTQPVSALEFGSAQLDVISSHPEEGVIRRGAPIAEALRNHGGRRVLIVALDDPDATGSTLDIKAAQRWAESIGIALNHNYYRLHLYLPRLPLPLNPPTQMHGWPTLVLSPEDSANPSAPKQTKQRIDGPDALAEYAAPAIAGLTGLWQGHDSTPVLDGADGQISTGEAGNLRLVRVFHRRIDTTQMEAEARGEVLDVTNQLPQTLRGDGRRVMIAPDSEEVVGKMSATFLQIAQQQLISPQEPLSAPKTTQISAWQAVKKFFHFFFTAVIGGPKSWYQSQVGALQKGFAVAVQKALYGQGPAVEVVCGMHSGHRQLHNMEMVGRAAAELRETLDNGADAVRIGRPPALSEMWRAYVDTSLTLTDGTERQQGSLPMPKDHNDNPMIVAQPRMVVPDYSERFDGASTALTNIMGQSLGATTIEPYDPYAADMYSETVNFAARQTTDRAVSDLQQKFRVWRGQHERSFAWRIGTGLTGYMHQAQQQMLKCRDELGQINQQIESIGAGDDSKPGALVRKLRIVTLVWLLASLVLGYFTLARPLTNIRMFENMPTVPWNWGLLVFVLGTVVALAVMMVIFARSQRGIMDEIAMRENLAEDQAILSRNFHRSVADVERISGAYSQFISWSALVGRAISQPFGPQQEAANPVQIPHYGMPAATVIARAANGGASGETLNAMRNSVFQPNWAGDSLQSLLNSAIVAAQHEGVWVEDQSQLFGQPGRLANSQLDRVSDIASKRNLPRQSNAEVAWARALDQLARTNAAHSLMGNLHGYRDGKVQQYDLAQLTSSMDTRSDAGFSNQAMNATGNNANGTNVDKAASTLHLQPEQSAGPVSTLSQLSTLVQYGHMSQAGWVSSSASAQAKGAETAQDVEAKDDFWSPDFGKGLV